jgi:hypothetical protein
VSIKCQKSLSRKQMTSYNNDGHVVGPEEVMLELVSRWVLRLRSIMFDEGDCFALICLMQRKPTRSLGCYIHKLHCLRWTTVSKMTISCFFTMPCQFMLDFACLTSLLMIIFLPTTLERRIWSLRTGCGRSISIVALFLPAQMPEWNITHDEVKKFLPKAWGIFYMVMLSLFHII